MCRLFFLLLFLPLACFSVEYDLTELHRIYETRLSLAYGDRVARLEFYYFTRWDCDACRKTDLIIQQLSQDILKSGKLYFITEPGVENYSVLDKLNASLLVNNHLSINQYFSRRDILIRASKEEKMETFSQLASAMNSMEPTVVIQNEEIVDRILRTEQLIASGLEVSQFPTVVIYHLDSRKKIMMRGASEISVENIEQALKQIKGDL